MLEMSVFASGVWVLIRCYKIWKKDALREIRMDLTWKRHCPLQKIVNWTWLEPAAFIQMYMWYPGRTRPVCTDLLIFHRVCFFLSLFFQYFYSRIVRLILITFSLSGSDVFTLRNNYGLFCLTWSHAYPPNSPLISPTTPQKLQFLPVKFLETIGSMQEDKETKRVDICYATWR